MNEAYLHYLWKHKKIPFHQLKLTSGKNVLIKNVGHYNEFESGPDFFNGMIEIDGLKWAGNIEIHVKSSDWYLHQHQNDKAYENVILHVVYHHDREVFINNKEIPTVELKNVLESQSFIKYFDSIFLNNEFPCGSFINQIDAVYIESMKAKSIVNRLNRKIISFKNYDLISNPNQVLYTLLAKSFGSKVNAQPFEEITNRIPIKILKKENSTYTKTIIKNISGVFENEISFDWIYLQMKYNFDILPKHIWKYKGLRPISFPENRVLQFISITEKFDFETTFTCLQTSDLLNYLLELLEIKTDILKISHSMKELIIINCFVPFLWWYGSIKMDNEIQEKSLDLLDYLKPEENYIIKKWKKAGVICRNSYDSQALLEIYSEFCKVKKCLQCDVGNNILKK